MIFWQFLKISLFYKAKLYKQIFSLYLCQSDIVTILSHSWGNMVAVNTERVCEKNRQWTKHLNTHRDKVPFISDFGFVIIWQIYLFWLLLYPSHNNEAPIVLDFLLLQTTLLIWDQLIQHFFSRNNISWSSEGLWKEVLADSSCPSFCFFEN